MKGFAVRKIVLQIMLAIIILGVASIASALRGGPDKFGYRYVDSKDSAGPAYSWEDYVPHVKDDAVDNNVAAVDAYLGKKLEIGFPFNFYGVDYEYIHVAGNGYLAFSSGEFGVDYYKNLVYSGQSLPSSGSPNGGIIAPFWSDLDVVG